MQLGESERFCPSSYLRVEHPNVRVVEMDLPGNVMGCVDHEQRIIWIARGLTEVQRRSTLAFEIGQLIHGPTPKDPCLAAAHRHAAGDWAARMLIGTDEFVEAFTAAGDLPGLAAHVGVDVQTFRARMRGGSDEEQDRVMAALRSLRTSA